MNKRERVRAALAGEPVDRVPVGLWGHDYVREWTAEGLAGAMVESVERFDYDFLKVNPRATYYAEAWGCRYRASSDPLRGPETVEWTLKSTADLERIQPVDVQTGAFGEQLEALRLIVQRLRGETPLMQTVFSPLAVVARLAENDLEAVRGYMDGAPDALHAALRVIAGTLARYAAACIDAGAGGIFLATVDWGTHDNLTRERFAAFSRPYDLEVLAGADDGWFNVFHVCRRNNMLFDLLDYPVHAFNWASTQEGNPSLSEALTKTDRAVMGGLNERATLTKGSPQDVRREAEAALSETGGRRFLLGPGCSVPPQAPDANREAAVAAARASSEARR